MKIWFDIGNPFQANFFHTLMEKLQLENEILVTTRQHGKTTWILRSKGINFASIGRHGGKSLKGKLKAYAHRVKELSDIIDKEKPDLLITERDPSAVRVAFGLNLPSFTLFYDEREYFVNHMVFPLSSKIFAPRFYSEDDLRDQGVIHLERVTWFNGFHTSYLKDLKTDFHNNPFRKMGLEKPIILIRPEFEFAAFFQDKKPILFKLVEILKKRIDVDIVVEPRTELQEKAFEKYPVKILRERFAETPVMYSDIVIGAADTMLQESFVLGIPAICCAYWKMSEPMKFLLRYIKHSTDSKRIAEMTEKYLDSKEREDFRRTSRKLVAKMDNPVEVIHEKVRVLSSLRNCSA